MGKMTASHYLLVSVRQYNNFSLITMTSSVLLIHDSGSILHALLRYGNRPKLLDRRQVTRLSNSLASVPFFPG